jgi:hypothetical protein
MKPIITNESVTDDLKSYVAEIKLFPDGKEPGIYYYKKTLSKKERQTPSTISSAIEAYQGSSRGNNIPSVDFMEDWKNSTRAPEITLLVQNPKGNEIGFWEQYHTTKHREDFPDDKINSKKNCYNSNNAQLGSKIYGVVSQKQMMEYISELKLQDEITRQRKEKTNLFEKMSLSRKRLKEIENAGNFIQSRAVVKKITSVKRYEGEQNKLSDLKNDFNDLQIYLPENPHELEKVGDGNQTYFAFKLVPQHEEMWGHGIPYEWHKHIGVSGEERMGNWFNQHPENAGDYIEGEDILKSIRNTIITNKDVILNKEGLPNMNQPFIDQCFKDQRYIESERASFKRTVLSEYKKKKSENDRLQGNVWNFGDGVINPNSSNFYPDDHDAYHKILKDVLKQFPKYSGNVKKVGEQKIHEDSTNSILKNMVVTGGHFPEYLLVVVWTKTIDSYKLHTEGAGLIRNQYLKKLLGLAIKNLQIVIFNPEKNTKVPTFFTVEDLNG